VYTAAIVELVVAVSTRIIERVAKAKAIFLFNFTPPKYNSSADIGYYFIMPFI
jgi:hypothetical protein